MKNHKGPLNGIKVLDWTMWQFGPVSTMMMADLGAEVIKIESLDGDHGRQFGQVSGVASNAYDGLSSHYFEVLNRQKSGIAVNLKDPRGQEIVHQLVKQSDVFVQNFRQGVAEKLTLGWEDLRTINPQLVYGSNPKTKMTEKDVDLVVKNYKINSEEVINLSKKFGFKIIFF